MSAQPAPPSAQSAPLDADVAAWAHDSDQERRSGAASVFADALKVSGRFDWPDAPPTTSCEAFLPALLDALGWTGETRHLLEALPHVDPIATLSDLADVLERLGYEATEARLRLDRCAASEFPLLYRDASGLTLALGRLGDGRLQLRRLDGDGAVAPAIIEAAPRCAVAAFLVAPKPPRPISDTAQRSFLRRHVRAVKDELVGVLCVSFAITLFSAATSFYSMFVYNMVIPSRAFDTLIFGCVLILAALAAENQLRRLRSQTMARLAVKLRRDILRDSVDKVLSLPIERTQGVSTASQVAQLKRLDNLAAVFQGPAATALLDMPFIIVFLILIAVIAGDLVLVPIALAVLFVLMAVAFRPFIRDAEADFAIARREASERVGEAVSSARAIQSAGVERIWLQRLSAAFDAEASALARSSATQQIVGHAAQMLVAFAAAAMLAVGAMKAMAGEVTIGALIAVMMLMWRVLSPIQTAFLSVDQLKSALDDFRLFERLMQLPDERSGGKATQVYRRFDGALKLDGVSYRFPKTTEFALRGVSLSVAPGQRLGVVGQGGSGKTTLLRLALGLYQPIAGKVTLDGLPLSQLDPGEVRYALAYAAERPQFFYGTVAQNMRLARSNVTDPEIEAQLESLGLTLSETQFPDGLETRLTGARRAQLGPGVLQQLNLARAFLAARPVTLLDDPSWGLDSKAVTLLLKQIDAHRARTAFIIISNDRRLLSRCDRLVVLEQGQVLVSGGARKVLKELDRAASAKANT